MGVRVFKESVVIYTPLGAWGIYLFLESSKIVNSVIENEEYNRNLRNHIENVSIK